MTQHQKDIVYQIVKEAGSRGIRTEQVKIQGLKKGISCSDRFLRWLAEEGKIDGCKLINNKTKTWLIRENLLPSHNDFYKETTEKIQAEKQTFTEKQLTMNFIKANSQALKGFLA